MPYERYDFEFSHGLTKDAIIEMRNQKLEYNNSIDKIYHTVLEVVFESIVKNLEKFAIIDDRIIGLNDWPMVILRLTDQDWAVKLFKREKGILIETDQVDKENSSHNCFVVANVPRDIDLSEVDKNWEYQLDLL